MGERRTDAEPAHVRDISRREGELQVCSCGHLTRTVEQMRFHLAEARDSRRGRLAATSPRDARVSAPGATHDPPARTAVDRRD